MEHGFPSKASAITYDPELDLMALGTRSGALRMWVCNFEMLFVFLVIVFFCICHNFVSLQSILYRASCMWQHLFFIKICDDDDDDDDGIYIQLLA